MLDLTTELQEVATTCPPEFKLQHLVNPENKWLVRSAFQKAVRRGMLDVALRCGALLYTADYAYAWRSLAIIIVEDVGFADLDLLSYSAVIPYATTTRATGVPFQLFGALIQRACKSYKTRAFCELSLGADTSPNTLWDVHRNASTDALLDNLSAKSVPDLYATLVVLRERCRKDKTGKLMEAVLTKILASLPDEKAARAAMFAFEKPVDNMHLAVWPLLNAGFHTDHLSVLEATPPPSITIKGLPSAAWDMHVADGKRAIKAFYTSLHKKQHPTIVDLGKATTEVVKALGSMIFVLEGGHVDFRLWSSALMQLKEFQDTSYLATTIPEGLEFDLRVTVTTHFDLLNQKREWVSDH